MDSKKLEILMTAVNLGSFSKASEVVGYTQSGLTHLMNGLEREIGMTLIRRDHSGIALTEAGEALLPAIREYLSATAKLENQIAAIAQKKAEEPIRIAAYASLAMHWMPEILYRFRRVCPDTDVDLRMVDHELEPFELLEAGPHRRDFRRPAEPYQLRLDAPLQRRHVCHPAGGLSHRRAGDLSHRGIRREGVSDALRAVRYRRERRPQPQRGEAHHPPLLRGRRDGDPHGQQGAWHHHDDGDHDAGQDPAASRPCRSARRRDASWGWECT